MRSSEKFNVVLCCSKEKEWIKMQNIVVMDCRTTASDSSMLSPVVVHGVETWALHWPWSVTHRLTERNCH